MTANVLLMGWERSIPGRETLSAEHFQDMIGYLSGLQQAGSIESWQVILLDPHGGDLNGFFLIHGSPEQISAHVASDDWSRHLTRGLFHLQHMGAVTGATGELVMERMSRWQELTPD